MGLKLRNVLLIATPLATSYLLKRRPVRTPILSVA